MNSFSITVPARFCAERDGFETLSVIADAGGDTVDLISEDKRNVIRLDLFGVAELESAINGIVRGRRFQDALWEKIAEHNCRHNAIDPSVS